MTENDRNTSRSTGQVPKDNDPLLELTRLFDFERTNPSDASDDDTDESSFHPTLQENDENVSTDEAVLSDNDLTDEFDLSFLEMDLEESLNADLPFESENITDSERTLDHSSDAYTSSTHHAEETKKTIDSSFDELYDMPSFTPKTRFKSTEMELNEESDHSPLYNNNTDEKISYQKISSSFPLDDIHNFQEHSTKTNIYSSNSKENTEKSEFTEFSFNVADEEDLFLSFNEDTKDHNDDENLNDAESFFNDDAFDNFVAQGLKDDEVHQNKIFKDFNYNADLKQSNHNYTQTDHSNDITDIENEDSFDTELENLLLTDPLPVENETSLLDTNNDQKSLDTFSFEEDFDLTFEKETLSTDHQNISQSEVNVLLDEEDPFGFDDIFSDMSNYENNDSNDKKTPESYDQSFASETLSPSNNDTSYFKQPETYRANEHFQQTDQNSNLETDNELIAELSMSLKVDANEDTFEPLQDENHHSSFSQSKQNQSFVASEPLNPSTELPLPDNSIPDVDTYKFADNIVETTEIPDLPNISYEEELQRPSHDDFENEFSEVFSVGNRTTPLEQTHTDTSYQNEFYQETTFEQNNDFEESQIKFEIGHDENYETNTADSFGQFPHFEDAINHAEVDFIPAHLTKTSTTRKVVLGSVIFLLVIGVAYAASKFFSSSDNTDSAMIIQADQTPIKVHNDTTQAQNNAANNQDVYNQATGLETSTIGTQNSLIDKSETPEDLAALNEQVPQTDDSYMDPSNIEDAIAAASNQTVPTREVQTVTVNPDGTVSSVSPVVENNTPQNPLNDNKIITTQTNNQVSANAILNNTISNGTNTNVHISSINQQNTQGIIADASHTGNSQQVTQTTTTPPQQNNQTTSQANDASENTSSSNTSGGYYVQIASHPTQNLAQTSLNKAKSQYNTIIGNLPMNIESAEIPGRGTYYRVRIQVGPRDNAILVCQKIKEAHGTCFVGR
ncbi:SPOR domain-containing protein [Bartonella tamiae]|uniref:SPOR domain-containing protein n=1 Tax=Bartonella tamiae Th239 TaxID=1094558 RepID=J0ZKJ0_9HYPH|nr:SPOR domain-containing protein [Bartonella tamiae]EJF88873.1 hypothetical protein ME5_01424 [Bartonella tamiae Th239]EJF94877.1 hypothetical protein MEG_00458 [Bartonella tamiae Th307]